MSNGNNHNRALSCVRDLFLQDNHDFSDKFLLSFSMNLIGVMGTFVFYFMQYLYICSRIANSPFLRLFSRCS